jgi:hypothetical protein
MEDMKELLDESIKDMVADSRNFEHDYKVIDNQIAVRE